MIGRGSAASTSLSMLESRVRGVAHDLAVLLVFDRPERVLDRPGLAKTYFAERCLSAAELNEIVSALRAVGAYVELFAGEKAFVESLASGAHQIEGRSQVLVYNGIEGGVATDGFKPGRKALIPALCDAFGLACANSDAFACALGRHKFHYFTVLAASGLPVPRTWHYRLRNGWADDKGPPIGTDVIVKSTFEAWSVGVTLASRFEVDESVDARASEVAAEIGQSVTVQEFIAGREVEVSVFSTPDPVAAPPVLSVLSKAPGDPQAFVTFDDNVLGGALSYELFTGSAQLIERLQRLACRAFDSLDLFGFARIDFRVDSDGHPWIIDVGVSPDVGQNTSSWIAVEALGLSHPEFIRAVIGSSLVQNGT